MTAEEIVDAVTGIGKVRRDLVFIIQLSFQFNIDHMRRLNIDPGLAAYPPNMLFNLYANLHVHLAVITKRIWYCTSP